jgi:two-component system NtrC family sensor kinase
MNVHFLLAVIASCIYFLVGFFVFWKRRDHPINRSFSLMLLCISTWYIDVAGILASPTPEFADLWGKIFRNGLLFIPPCFLHFILSFTNLQRIADRPKKILLIFYSISGLFAVLNWTPYLTKGVRMSPLGYQVQSGPIYPLFILEFVVCLIFSFYYLIVGFIGAETYQRQRLKFFFLAISISFVLGSIDFLRMLGFEIYPIGSIVGCIGLLIAAYSVVQHRLMDVSVFMAKGLGFILSFAILGVPFFFIILLIEETFFQRKDIPSAVILILFGVASILLFNYIKVRVDRAMHQIIVKDKYNYHQILRDFSRRLVTIVDLDRLLNMLADTVEKSMGVKRISIFLLDPEKKNFRPRLLRDSPKGEPIKISEPAIQFLQDRREAVLRIELDWVEKKPVAEELAAVLSRYEAEVFLPLIFMDRLIGFISLGPKAEQQIYYPEDLNLLYPLANQVAIAIENSNLYDSLKKSQTIIRRADRLASLGTLVASLAHEIRNPLVSIKTFTQLLPERIDDEEFRNYFLKVASGEIDRLTGLINELLGFARPSEPRLEGEDIHVLIDKMEVLIATEARKKNVTLHKNYAPDLPQVRIDAEQIKQVLLNILLNAIQSIRGEGEIWVETRMVQVSLDEKIEPFIQVEVRDTGVGIPQENLERIFDPFFSTRPEGSGLGLAISHQIIHDHRGFITVESEVAKGTSFKIHLPLKTGGIGVVQKQSPDIAR